MIVKFPLVLQVDGHRAPPANRVRQTVSVSIVTFTFVICASLQFTKPKVAKLIPRYPCLQTSKSISLLWIETMPFSKT